MRRILPAILFIFGFWFANAQKPSKNGGSQNVQNLLNILDHDTCLNKQFSIVFYIILDSNLSIRTSTQPTLNMVIDTLNAYFKPICVSFVNCSTVIIPNYPYNRWKRSATDPVVTSNWYAEKTINFYIVDSVKDEATNPETRGYAHLPRLNVSDTVKDVIVVERYKPNSRFFANMLHSMGHFFGLSHTYLELNSANPASPGPPNGVVTHEYADGSNGSIHGDLIPDTEADPGGSHNRVDGKGDFYVRPIDNIMGFSKGCRFTQQQYNLMAYTILTKRLYLH